MKYYLLLVCLLISIAQAQTAFPIKKFTKDEEEKIKKNLELIEKYQQENDFNEASRYLSETAFIYWEHNFFNEAIKYYEKAKTLSIELGNVSGATKISNNLGLIYSDLDENERALKNFKESLAYRLKLGDKQYIVNSLVNIGALLNRISRHEEAIEYLDKATQYALQLDDLDRLKTIYGLLAENYQKTGNTQKMIEYYELYRRFTSKAMEASDRIRAESQLKLQLAEKENKIKQLELEKKQNDLIAAGERSNTLLDSLNRKQLSYLFLEKEKQRAELEISLANSRARDAELEKENERTKRRNHTLTLISITSIILIITIFAIFTLVRTRKTNRTLADKNHIISEAQHEILAQKQELEITFNDLFAKNRNITASINYAKRIQQGMFNGYGSLADILPNSFILFLPRDVISGDFFWFTKINNLIIIACVDCTGHGVPGGLMSIMGIGFLNQIIKGEKVTDPSAILTKLNDRIYNSLNQESQDALQDGMDASIVTIDNAEKRLLFSGAKHDLISVDNLKKVERIKGDRYSIGGSMKRQTKEYTTKEILLDDPKSYYMSTDGYPDQFGGVHDRKLLLKNFRKLLALTSSASFKEQQEAILESLEAWKKGRQQTDDILVIGFKTDL